MEPVLEAIESALITREPVQFASDAEEPPGATDNCEERVFAIGIVRGKIWILDLGADLPWSIGKNREISEAP